MRHVRSGLSGTRGDAVARSGRLSRDDAALRAAEEREPAMTEWNAFFTALAGAAAIEFSVAFAALSLGAGRWRVTVLRPAAVALALIQLLVPLLAALIALMPGDTSWQVGYLVM